MGTASALREVQARVYGASSYNKDFASVIRAFQAKHPTLPTSVDHEITRCPTDLQNESLSQDQCSQSGQLCQDDNESVEEREEMETDIASGDDANDKDSEIGSAASDTSDANTCTHGHMICTSDGTSVLPDHMIITDLSDLPTHFRRVTTKYTRNRCPMFPCRVPFYLWRKRQLLPTALTSLNGGRDKDTTIHEEVCR